jgi:site-specific DNA-methyltransferase (adenine-specific)
MAFTIHHGDCREVMATLDAESVDAIVSDPPYGLSFMGKGWDHGVPGVEFWTEALRVAKPGAHLLAFGGTRTYHRLACAIEDAGWEIRDCVMWVYGSGFPKSHDVSKAIDKAAGAEREVVGPNPWNHVRNHSPEAWNGATRTQDGKYGSTGSGHSDITAPATEAARQWSGWGTALKPAWEPIIVARKPLDGTVAGNVLTHGTGGINVDGCRVGASKEVPASVSRKATANCYAGGWREAGETPGIGGHDPNLGRWPANLIHDGSEEVVGLFPQTRPGESPARRNSEPGSGRTMGSGWHGEDSGVRVVLDSGSAARFFYCAKASKADRDEGCEGLEERDRADQSAWVRKCNVCGDTFCDPKTSKPHFGHDDFSFVSPSPRRNHHPTVKPTDLMRYLCRLVTPPGGVVLDPFTGSGSTGKGAVLEGFRFIGIEREAEYVEIAKARIAAVSGGGTLF